MDGEGIGWGTSVQFLDAMPKPTMAEVAGAACVLFGLSIEALKSPCRAALVSKPRQAAMAVTRKMTGYSYPQIGTFYKRDHTTALWAFRQWEGGLLPQADKLYSFMTSKSLRETMAKAREDKWTEAESRRAEEARVKAEQIEKQVGADSGAYWRREAGFHPPIIMTGVRDHKLVEAP